MDTPAVTYAYMKEHKLHSMVYRFFNVLVSEREGKRLMSVLNNFVKAHTLPELRLICQERGFKATGTKNDMSVRLLQSDMVRYATDPASATEDVYSIDRTKLVRKHTLIELREMCDQRGISSFGNKRGLAARLIEFEK